MLRRETGQILPGLIVLMLAILALGMLTFRIGRAAVLRSDAQTAADAAALAGARSVRDQLTAQVMSTGTSDLARVSEAVARAAAADYAQRNGARLTDFKMDGADVRAFVDTGEQQVDPPKDDRRGKARARARVELVFGTASSGGGNMGPPPGHGDPTISPREWKSIAGDLHSPPGCADLVKLGRFLRSHGGQILENAALGDPPAPGVHVPGSYHYRCGGSGALDVNYDQTGNEKGIIDALIGPIQKLGFRTIWQAPGHFDHAHVDVANTPSISGGPAGAVGPLQDTLLDVRLVDWNAPSPSGFAGGFVGGPGGIPFGPPDPHVANAMCQVLSQLHVSATVRLAAWETAIVESGVKALTWGTSDSQGPFQQRPSQGWGTVEQVRDPYYATRKFVSVAKRLERVYPDPGVLAQKVQRSAHPERYAQRAGQAAALDRRFCGGR
jgi:hypothetical protein